jgi:hypothetical protein
MKQGQERMSLIDSTDVRSGEPVPHPRQPSTGMTTDIAASQCPMNAWYAAAYDWRSAGA